MPPPKLPRICAIKELIGLHSSVAIGYRRKINEEVRQMMKEIFPCLEQELINFIQYGDKLDNL